MLHKAPNFFGRITDYLLSIFGGFLAGSFVFGVWFGGYEILAIIIGAIVMLWLGIGSSIGKGRDFKDDNMRKYYEHHGNSFAIIFVSFLAALLFLATKFSSM